MNIMGLLGGAPWSADPDRNQAIDRAMTMLGAGLLSGAGSGQNFSSILGQSMAGAQNAYDSGMTDALKRRLLQGQMEDAQAAREERRQAAARQKQIEDLARSAYRPASPGSLGGGVAPGSQQGIGLMGGMTGGASPEDRAFDAALLASDNAVLNQNSQRQGGPVAPVAPPTAGGFDTRRFVDSLYGAGLPMEAMRLQKDMIGEAKPVVVGDSLVDPVTGRVVFQGTQKPMNVAPGGTVIDPATGRVVFQAADRPQAQTEIEKLIAARAQLPAGSPDRNLIDDRIAALNYRQPPSSMNVSYGAPFAAINPTTGQPELFQASNRGGPPQPMGIAPPPKEQPPAPERFNTAIAGINELRNALTNYERVVNEAGGPNMVARGANRANLQAAYTAFQMGLKNAMELGALAGPDVEILGRFVQDPTSINAAVVLGDKGVSAQIEQARRYLQNREQAITQTYQRPNPAGGPRATPQRLATPAGGNPPGTVLRFDTQGNLIRD